MADAHNNPQAELNKQSIRTNQCGCTCNQVRYQPPYPAVFMVLSRTTTLKAKALQLLAMREYSRAQMQSKLLHWASVQTAITGNNDSAGSQKECGYTEAAGEGISACDDASSSTGQQSQIEAVLDDLQEKGLLDDYRAAEALLRQRASKLGSVRLQQELLRKGIDEGISRQLLQGMAESELDRAGALWQKKFGKRAGSPAERARQARFLASRGFSTDIIHRVMRQREDNAD